MKSFTDKQSAVALVLIFLLFCFVSNDDYYVLQSMEVATNGA